MKTKPVTLYRLELALALMAQHHQQMGHPPVVQIAMTRERLKREYGMDALRSVDDELSKMGDESFHEAVVGSATKVPMTHLTGNVLLTMLESITKIDEAQPIRVKAHPPLNEHQE